MSNSFVYDGVIGAFRVVNTLTGISDLVYVRAASTVNLGATYSAGTLTATADGALVLDQVALVATNRALLKNQATLAHNGIYDVVDPGDETHPFILTRSSDCDSAEALATYPTIVVTEGAANSSTGLQLLSTGNIELGVTGLRFTQFTGGVSGVTSDQLDAIGLSAAPSAANVFATMDDLSGLGGSGLTVDQQAAVDGAAAPSATNVFATMDDLSGLGGSSLSADQTAAITGGQTPSATNPFITTTKTSWVLLGSTTSSSNPTTVHVSDSWTTLITQTLSGDAYKEFMFVATFVGGFAKSSIVVPYQDIIDGGEYYMSAPAGNAHVSVSAAGGGSTAFFYTSSTALSKSAIYGRYSV